MDWSLSKDESEIRKKLPIGSRVRQLYNKSYGQATILDIVGLGVDGKWPYKVLVKFDNGKRELLTPSLLLPRPQRTPAPIPEPPAPQVQFEFSGEVPPLIRNAPTIGYVDIPSDQKANVISLEDFKPGDVIAIITEPTGKFYFEVNTLIDYIDSLPGPTVQILNPLTHTPIGYKHLPEPAENITIEIGAVPHTQEQINQASNGTTNRTRNQRRRKARTRRRR